MRHLRRNPELRPSPWGKDLVRRDLSGRNLALMDLAGANLRGTHFTGANLAGADLSGADLREAYFKGADLTGANLSGAYLRSAYLGEANLTDANFIKADLEDAGLSESNLTGAKLNGADLTRAYIRDTNLSRADLSGANLEGADLRGANLSGVNLSGANLSFASFSDAYLGAANLSRANCYFAEFRDADLEGANLSGAKLTFARLAGADLRGADLRDVELSDNDLENVDLTQALNAPRFGPLREHYEIKTPTSPAFKKWFGNSVVVGDDKKPVIVYHGTARGGFTVFDPSKRDEHHNAFYFTDDLVVADTYVNAKKPHTRPDPAAEPNAPVGVYRLYIKLVNPMVVECQGSEWHDLHDPRAPGLTKTFKLAKWAQEHGHDGVIFKDIVDDGGRGGERAAPATVYAVFDPRAIKSATANNGNYDPNDPDIRHNPRHRLSRRNPSLGKTWAELREDLREIGHGVLGEQILSTTLKTCSSTAPAVMQYLLERGHIVAPGGQDRPSGYTNHYDLAVLTSDRGWLNVDPTFMQFHCKHQPSEDEDKDEDWSDLAELKRHLQAAWADPMVTYRIDPLPWPPTPRGAVKVQAPPVLSKVGSWADYWKKYKHYATSAVDKARRQAAGEDVGRFKPLPYASLVVSFDPNDPDIRHNPRRPRPSRGARRR